MSDVVVDRLQATYEEFKLMYGAKNVHHIPCDVTDKTQVKGTLTPSKLWASIAYDMVVSK